MIVEKNATDPTVGDPAETALRIATACQILAVALLDPIDSALVEHFSSPSLVAAWPLPNKASKYGTDLLLTAIEQGDGPGTTEAIKRDHLYLFGDAGKPLACPYESPYVSRDGLVFDQATFEVRNWYRRYGFEIEALNRQPDDHLGYELAFAAILAESLSDPAPSAGVFDDLTTFTRDHLAVFAYSVAEGIATHAQTVFYQACAHLLTGTLDALRDFTTATEGVSAPRTVADTGRN